MHSRQLCSGQNPMTLWCCECLPCQQHTISETDTDTTFTSCYGRTKNKTWVFPAHWDTLLLFPVPLPALLWLDVQIWLSPTLLKWRQSVAEMSIVVEMVFLTPCAFVTYCITLRIALKSSSAVYCNAVANIYPRAACALFQNRRQHIQRKGTTRI